ncbi:hypothetical protein SAMN04488063_0113 [Halopelagius inordinatus]|uniref:Uncharacterized protein n=1 Tax=Halopelagius inordinatus TaxID=553467 RepID=A0A1I2X4F6_9EURY|nr:hypothetical protein [Halopelagius inordinatus]SFH07819.1 hypothetical protein SAMN04488063_0113 [Halopelagius inordinatus]
MSADGTWHAVCRDCKEFEQVGEYTDILTAGKQHQDDEGHRVSAGRVDE